VIAFGWVINLLQQGAASIEAAGCDFRHGTGNSRYRPHGPFNPALSRGKSEFRDVTLTHKGTARPSLNNIALHIKKGMTVAIVGYTGSGKSTLVNLIPAPFMDAGNRRDGSHRWKGHTRPFPFPCCDRTSVMVPQETFLFSDTITENIRYGVDEATGRRGPCAASVSQISRDVSEFPSSLRP